MDLITEADPKPDAGRGRRVAGHRAGRAAGARPPAGPPSAAPVEGRSPPPPTAAVLLLCHTNRVASGQRARPLRRHRRAAQESPNDAVRADRRGGQSGRRAGEDEHRRSRYPHRCSRSTRFSTSTPTEDDDGTVPELVWIGDSDRTAREHAAAAYETDHGDDRQDRADATQWLREYIAMSGPTVLSADAKREGVKAGLSERTLQRARQDLKGRVRVDRSAHRKRRGVSQQQTMTASWTATAEQTRRS